MSLRIPLMKPFFSDEVRDAAVNALENEKLVLGESVHKFEEELARYCGTKCAVTTSSGTSALQMALIASGITRGDQVVTTPFSFVATANSVIHAGGDPVFADIDSNTLNIDPKRISEKLLPSTKAIMPVHLYGHPSDMDEINLIARENRVQVIEDACQAHGAVYKGKRAGNLGDMGCFSFYPSKNMTVCGDGGAVVTSDEDKAKLIAKLADCGRSSKYVHDVIGYTSRLNTVSAAIGRVQLRHLDGWNDARRKLAKRYSQLLSDVEPLRLPPLETETVKPVHHLYVIRTKLRDGLKKWLEGNEIECGIHYPVPIHLQPIYVKLYGYHEGDFPESEAASEQCLSLPMHPFLSDDEIKFISEKIHEFYSRVA